ncbi:LamG domain-containing protein [bacterium]|nr:MAG: LamG domain-containing protein [bacterium]
MNSRLSSLSTLKRALLLGAVLATSASLSLAADTTKQVFAPTAQQNFAGRSDWTRENVKDLPIAGNAPWTINMFVRPEKALYELTLIGGFGNGHDEKGSQRYVGRTGDGIHFWGGNVDIESSVPFDVGGWQMITATFDGRTVTLYKNGEAIKAEQATLSDAAPIVRLAPTGTWPQQEQHQFNGRIQGFTVWNNALSAQAIRALMSGMPKK